MKQWDSIPRNQYINVDASVLSYCYGFCVGVRS